MKHLNRFVNICILLLILLLINCKKSAVSLNEGSVPVTFDAVFEQFWNKMNSNYVYWDVDTTNWDNIYLKYKPLFGRLKTDNQMDSKTALGYFESMTAGLIDAHYTINFLSPYLLGQTYSPVSAKKANGKTFHSAYPYTSIDTGYLDKGYIVGTYASADNGNLTVICGTINKSIGYFSCDKFALQEALNSGTANTVQTSLQQLFAWINKPSTNIKEIIIDIRNNPGGNLTDLNFLIGRLISAPLKIGFSRYKSGLGRLDYTPWLETVITPVYGSNGIKRPVIALVDNFTISTAEAVAMSIHAMPNGTVVGEQTWGATGPVTDNEVYNDGPFKISGFLNVYEASAEFKFIDGKRYESVGFTPDILIPFDFTALSSYRDPPLEKAISLAH